MDSEPRASNYKKECKPHVALARRDTLLTCSNASITPTQTLS
ncbi:hypothetical protein D042_2078 [Vibrio parahaemolyticus NIHCB0757]|nr:hypothetical protein D042_2078 [Vibrio parahaemolyticus NIHCB0757]